ncbi:TRAP transporter small permease subunit [Ensifer sp. ENS04]|uniref:TRAP transporter small permease n=1 Tax=Ensifer sp. ENS04 TaxID=2769281 RepID=UPI0017814B69|nr:TRAP transporter small permease subunit [Ensifer sp. ENS04]MBD9541453.1 TRAP transporter small permease subunit [Ensifer sp. ENS04]
MSFSSMEQQPNRSCLARIGKSVTRLSASIASAERCVLVMLAGGIVTLILLNVATRYMGHPIFWVDELAVYMMVAMCFIGTSLTIRRRLDFAVTFIIDMCGVSARRRVNASLTMVSVAYALFLCWCAWRMFDPVGLLAAGLDTAQFTTSTHNYLYSEPTQTLGFPKFWVLLVMPIFAITSLVHSLANLSEDLALVERRPDLLLQTDMG